LVDAIRRASRPEHVPTAIIAIDGCGGAGKSTLAAKLAEALGDAPIVSTDDFASWDNPNDWWPRLLHEVLEPLRNGQPARYRRYDWASRRLENWIDVPAAPTWLILEGVGAARLEFEPYLTFRIWVEAPRAVRLQRGIARDGDGMHAQWLEWMSSEDAYVEADRPDARADVVVSGVS
jgi:uridine kinase